MACAVASEVAALLAVVRRSIRWGGGSGGERLDHPLVAGLKSLRRRVASLDARVEAGAADLLLYLGPFLDVVRSGVGSAITGAALSSL